MNAEETKTKVTILTDAYRVKGYIELIPGARITDFLADSRDFIAVTDAEVWELAIGGREILAAPGRQVIENSYVVPCIKIRISDV